MKKVLGVLLSIFILLSCTNNKEKDHVSIVKLPSNEQVESINGIESSNSNGVIINHTSFSSSCIEQSKSDDNMRGFDPISEDDMEDGGMSRYMENYDEEGWN